jgi:hypothetical protein
MEVRWIPGAARNQARRTCDLGGVARRFGRSRVVEHEADLLARLWKIAPEQPDGSVARWSRDRAEYWDRVAILSRERAMVRSDCRLSSERDTENRKAVCR